MYGTLPNTIIIHDRVSATPFLERDSFLPKILSLSFMFVMLRRVQLPLHLFSCNLFSHHTECFLVNMLSSSLTPAAQTFSRLDTFYFIFLPFEERTNHKVTNFMFTPCCSNENASWSGDVVLLTGCTGRRLNKLDKHRDRDNNRTDRV